MNTLVELINSMETREDDENFKNAVDFYFDELENGNKEEGIPPKPDHFALRQYKKYKLAAGDISYKGHITIMFGHTTDMSNIAESQVNCYT